MKNHTRPPKGDIAYTLTLGLMVLGMLMGMGCVFVFAFFSFHFFLKDYFVKKPKNASEEPIE